ncbi:uncharacterized protein LOC125371740 [Haliotis rufescens]|uniref:uncharacterized protein LOC125371740 n=1 Tax=Haliotis rufescens TaxID=6454 RepID=UPI00201F88A1|nr:uncharacterized protein LOC125371740 [Haliotis rufescens]
MLWEIFIHALVLGGFTIPDNVHGQEIDCETYVLRTDVPRIQKIYRCLSGPKSGPKLVLHQVCPLVKMPSSVIQLDTSTQDIRPVMDDVIYQFQIIGNQSTVASDVISTVTGLSLHDCSVTCTGNPSCMSFAHAVDGTCVLARACKPSMTAQEGFSVYDMAYWYQD